MKLSSVRNARLAAAALLTCLVGAGGCSQSYNGALGLEAKDRQTVRAYERQRTQEAARLSASADKPVMHFHTAAPDTPKAADRNDAAFAYFAAALEDPNRVPSRPAAPARRANATLSLFGQIESGQDARVSPLDGQANLSRVTFTAEGADFDPAVDPAGERLVYASTRHREQPDLYLKNVDGTTITQLTNDPGRDVMPVFSPDGQRVAFASDRSGNWDIYITDVRGGPATQITNDPTHEIHPSFSPDGRRLVYSSFGGSSGQWEMVVVDLDNPGTRRFIGHGLFPRWSPVEDKILFQRARQRGTRWFSIWTVDLVNGEAVAPTEIAASASAAIITPDWSPDGQHIVFCTVIDPGTDEQSRPQHADVWVIGADGTHRTRLTDGQFANLQPVWAADDVIYFVSDRGVEGTENIWAVRPDRAVRAAHPRTAGVDDAAVRGE